MENCDDFSQLEKIETYDDITENFENNEKPKVIQGFKAMQDLFKMPLHDEL